ncbi:MAG TPA: AmmeMemoRadiSam system protein A [Vicinamibacteria bacterium]|nr:AmmeMemoRadiSam system protein A [Vicinamibacteria bacterium]
MSGRADPSAPEPGGGRQDLSAAAQRRLLALARRAIEAQLSRAAMAGSVLANGRMAESDPTGPGVAESDLADLRAELERRSGAFVTLTRRRGGELRGCVGLPEPLYRLDEAVARAAVAAALYDGRFDPVHVDELPALSLHVSVLGELRPIPAAHVEVGVHGLVVRHAGRSGLLLPQVAAERRWDRERFLDETCRKAGLRLGTWREPGCEILAFTATVFGEEE